MALADGSSTPDLVHGAAVTDNQGRHLGKISEVSHEYFKLDVHMARDYWLPFDLIASHDAEEVKLKFPEDELAPYKQYSGIEHLPEEELEGTMDLNEGDMASERRYEAQSEFLEQTRQG